jgi:hypothetical protein
MKDFDIALAGPEGNIEGQEMFLGRMVVRGFGSAFAIVEQVVDATLFQC